MIAAHETSTRRGIYASFTHFSRLRQWRPQSKKVEVQRPVWQLVPRSLEANNLNDGRTHIRFSGSILPCILAKLFTMMTKAEHVRGFGQSYIVLILKSAACNTYGKTTTVDDYRDNNNNNNNNNHDNVYGAVIMT